MLYIPSLPKPNITLCNSLTRKAILHSQILFAILQIQTSVVILKLNLNQITNDALATNWKSLGLNTKTIIKWNIINQ